MGNTSGSSYSKLALPQWYAEGSRSYGKRGFENASKGFCVTDLEGNLKGRVAIITGANRGLGFATAKALASKHASVHMLCRDALRGTEARDRLIAETGNPDVTMHEVDVSDFDAIRSFAKEFGRHATRLDVLINNAGGMPSERQTTPQGNEVIMATMLGGCHLLTGLMAQLLKAAATPTGLAESSSNADASGSVSGGFKAGTAAGRVINVSSAGMYLVKGSSRDLNGESRTYDGTFTYSMAKRLQVMLTELWARRFQKEAGEAGPLVTVNSMHPGWSDTPGLQIYMPGFHARQKHSLRTQEQGADTIVWLAAAGWESGVAPAGRTGEFWFDRRPQRTHLRLAGTTASAQEEAQLWRA
ncbi:unnamed protein product, partial [Phaeothamnion confervicola]